MEDDGDGFDVNIRDFFLRILFLCQGLCSDVSVGYEQCMENCWDCSIEDTCVWVE